MRLSLLVARQRAIEQELALHQCEKTQALMAERERIRAEIEENVEQAMREPSTKRLLYCARAAFTLGVICIVAGLALLFAKAKLNVLLVFAICAILSICAGLLFQQLMANNLRAANSDLGAA